MGNRCLTVRVFGGSRDAFFIVDRGFGQCQRRRWGWTVGGGVENITITIIGFLIIVSTTLSLGRRSIPLSPEFLVNPLPQTHSLLSPDPRAGSSYPEANTKHFANVLYYYLV